MKYAKIMVKNNYEKRGDLVLRSYIRALKKIKAYRFLDGDNAFIYGIVNDNNEFYEMYTRERIFYDDYDLVNKEEFLNAYSSKADNDMIEKVIQRVLFNKDVDLNIIVSRAQDKAEDRKIEFEAFLKFRSRINPYQRLSEDNNAYSCNEYDNFLRKVEEINVMKMIDSFPMEDDEYEVLENPKRLVRQ